MIESYFTFYQAEIDAIFLSLKVALYCSVFILPLAVLGGWILARKKFRGKSLLEGIINLPLVLPPVATGFLLLLLLGSKGIIGKILFDWFHIKIAFTFWAAVLASMVVAFPLAMRAIRLAIEMVDEAYEEAAKTLGANTFQAFWRITLPLAYPGIISGFILSFARSLGEFGATIIFAGNISGETQTIPLALFNQIQIPGHETAAFRLLIVAVLFSFIAMAFSEYLVRKIKKNKQ
jgi:molybdate transport system permease protein